MTKRLIRIFLLYPFLYILFICILPFFMIIWAIEWALDKEE